MLQFPALLHFCWRVQDEHYPRFKFNLQNPLVTKIKLNTPYWGKKASTNASSLHSSSEGACTCWPPTTTGSNTLKITAEQKDYWKYVAEACRNRCFLSGNVETKFYFTFSLMRVVSDKKNPRLPLSFWSLVAKMDTCLGCIPHCQLTTLEIPKGGNSKKSKFWCLLTFLLVFHPLQKSF